VPVASHHSLRFLSSFNTIVQSQQYNLLDHRHAHGHGKARLTQKVDYNKRVRSEHIGSVRTINILYVYH
jgi:hypothetical protein